MFESRDLRSLCTKVAESRLAQKNNLLPGVAIVLLSSTKLPNQVLNYSPTFFLILYLIFEKNQFYADEIFVVEKLHFLKQILFLF